MKQTLVLLVAAICLSLPTFNAAAEKVVKVFILAGQSNMEGKGKAHHLDTYKDDPLIKPWYGIMKDGGGWAQRKDVFITYPMNRRMKQGKLTVGYGSTGNDSIGPEFGFGHVVGEAYDEPVLIIKTAWGGKSITEHFRPPSAMPAQDEQGKKKYGEFYHKMVEQIKKELTTYQTKFPELRGYKPEVAGFVWHQGFNDIINKGLKANKYADYTKWLALLIMDLREEIGLPGMPVVIGELSTGGIAGRGDFQVAQANVAKIKALKGTVAFVPTAEYYDTVAHGYFKKGYWKGSEEEKAKWQAVGSDRPYHYLGSGKTFFLKGVAFGKAILELNN